MSEHQIPARESGGAKPVITLFEAYGSGAGYVGPRVAEQLRLPYHEQAFSSEQLEQDAADREQESVLSRVFTGLGRTSYGGLSAATTAGGVSEIQRDDHELVTENTRIVREYAAQGGVIFGRNGALILKNHPAALHVRLDGPVKARVERAATDFDISTARAAKRQKREDEVRAEMSLTFYGWDPRKIDHYDLVLNTGQLDLDTAVAIIVQAARVKNAIPTAGT